jgi:hypothetical protein
MAARKPLAQNATASNWRRNSLFLRFPPKALPRLGQVPVPAAVAATPAVPDRAHLINLPQPPLW